MNKKISFLMFTILGIALFYIGIKSITTSDNWFLSILFGSLCSIGIFTIYYGFIKYKAFKKK